MAQTVKSGKGVDLNRAKVEDLEHIGVLGRKRAQDIINYRNEHGPFKSWSDLEKVPGFSKKLADDLKNQGIEIR